MRKIPGLWMNNAHVTPVKIFPDPICAIFMNEMKSVHPYSIQSITFIFTLTSLKKLGKLFKQIRLKDLKRE
jgi:hypothetical protein